MNVHGEMCHGDEYDRPLEDIDSTNYIWQYVTRDFPILLREERGDGKQRVVIGVC